MCPFRIEYNPEEREYERTAATALNAAAMPLVGNYLDEIDSEVPKSAHFNLFHSAGGMASTAMVRERPLVLALSGPAAGVSAARQVARDLALENVLTLDMGGTTTDVCLITKGKPERRREASLAGRPIRQTMVGVQSIGAGGGSIAYVEAGMLRVGPQSAGASPGPACYGLGGLDPTVTDANLMLGYLDQAKPLADGVRLDLRLAEPAVSRLAQLLDLAPIETALGIVRVANANMVRAIRNVTVDRGIDGRRCTLSRIRRRRASPCGDASAGLRHSHGGRASILKRLLSAGLCGRKSELYPAAHHSYDERRVVARTPK